MSPRNSRTVRFVSLVVLLNVAALTVLGVIANRALSQAQANSHRIEVNAYRSCITRNTNIVGLNDLFDGIIAIEQDNPFKATSPQTIQRRIDLYKAAHLRALPCGEKP